MDYFYKIERMLAYVFGILGITIVVSSVLFSIIARQVISLAVGGSCGGIFILTAAILTFIYRNIEKLQQACIAKGVGTWGTIYKIEDTFLYRTSPQSVLAKVRGDDNRFYDSAYYYMTTFDSRLSPRAGDRVFIYVNPDQPNQYWVDMKSLRRQISDSYHPGTR